MWHFLCFQSNLNTCASEWLCQWATVPHITTNSTDTPLTNTRAPWTWDSRSAVTCRRLCIYHVHISVHVRMVDKLHIASCMVHIILGWKISKPSDGRVTNPAKGQTRHFSNTTANKILTYQIITYCSNWCFVVSPLLLIHKITVQIVSLSQSQGFYIFFIMYLKECSTTTDYVSWSN